MLIPFFSFLTFFLLFKLCLGLYNLPNFSQQEKSFFSFFNKTKLKQTSHLLVENAKEDFLYLFQHPRTSTIVGHPKALKVEIWLRWSGIEFYSLSNEWLLGSPKGYSPFAQFNGKYIYGSENIIKVMQKWKNSNIKKQKNKKCRQNKAKEDIKDKILIEQNLFNIASLNKNLYKDEEKIIQMAEGPLYNILFCDRVICNKNSETGESSTSSNVPKGGLEFLITDSGVREQVIPAIALSELMLDLDEEFKIGTMTFAKDTETSKTFIVKKAFENFWRDYFELTRNYNIDEKENIEEIIVEETKIKENNTKNKGKEIMTENPQNSKIKQIMDERNLLENKEKENNQIIEGIENIKLNRASSSVKEWGSTIAESSSTKIKNEQDFDENIRKNILNTIIDERANNYYNNNYLIKNKREIKINERKKIFNQKYFNGNLIILNDWPIFVRAMEKLINWNLREYFIEGNMSLDKRMKLYLQSKLIKMTENDIMKLFLKEISKNKIKERIEKNKFLFSEYPTKADASFFAILIQFFETPSNIKSLKDLFKLEGYLSEDDTKTIKILNKYIQNVKESLGYGGGKWEKLTDEKEKWPLNYDFDYSKNCNELKLDGKNDKYNGPFNLETGDLDHFVELFDEEIENDEKYKLSSFRYVEEVGKNETTEFENIILKIVHLNIFYKTKEVLTMLAAIAYKILGYLFVCHKYIEDVYKNIEEKYYKNNFISRFMLTEAAAYICNMGKDKSENDGKECKQKHINEWDDWKKINKEEGKTFEESLPSLKIKTRELVNEAINEENKRLISQRVHEAVKEAVNLQKIEQKEKMGKNKKGNKSEGKEEEGKFEKINLLEEE
ncbi:hypothetical protein ACQ4LE_002887 [Meloidogyne hapla]